MFTRAGIDTLTVGVFFWSLAQPAEDAYDLTVLDRILDRQAGAGRGPFALDPTGVAVLRLQ